VEIFGSEGAIYVDLQSMLCLKYGRKTSLNFKDLVSTSLSTVVQTLSGITANGFSAITGNFKVGHDSVIEQFIDSVINDTPPPVTGQEGREVIRVLGMLVDRLDEKYGRPEGD
jgi:predicted dehydrogenase